MRVLALATVCGCLLLAATAAANTSHEGWPNIDGALMMNKLDGTRPLDARPGNDPFGGQDPLYRCDQIHFRGRCRHRFVFSGRGLVVTSLPGHNELLGGHGNDTISAGPWGDVLWGDYKPSGQPTSQRDTLMGGAGNDFIYASHGYNAISAGAGDDTIHAHFGYGTIDCGAGFDTLFISRRSRKGYKIRGCDRLSYSTRGY